MNRENRPETGCLFLTEGGLLGSCDGCGAAAYLELEVGASAQ